MFFWYFLLIHLDRQDSVACRVVIVCLGHLQAPVDIDVVCVSPWSGADPGFVERGGGAAAVPFEDPLWNFKRGGGGRAPCGPPPLNPLVVVKVYIVQLRIFCRIYS